MTFLTSQKWVTTGPPAKTFSAPPFDTGAAEVPMEPRLLEGANGFVAAHGDATTEPASTTFLTSQTWVTTEPTVKTCSPPPFDKGAAKVPMDPRILEGADELVA